MGLCYTYLAHFLFVYAFANTTESCGSFWILEVTYSSFGCGTLAHLLSDLKSC